MLICSMDIVLQHSVLFVTAKREKRKPDNVVGVGHADRVETQKDLEEPFTGEHIPSIVRANGSRRDDPFSVVIRLLLRNVKRDVDKQQQHSKN